MNRCELSLVLGSADREVRCVVENWSSGGRSRLRLLSDETSEITVDGYDFEEALEGLRSKLEERGVLLLCNRFRRNALVTSLSRQMSGGLSCYLVKPHAKLDPEELYDCLGRADRSSVVTRQEGDDYVDIWKAWFEKPAVIRWLRRLR